MTRCPSCGARLITASAEVAWEGCGHLADPDDLCPACREGCS